MAGGGERPATLERASAYLHERVDGASLAVFRVLIGLVFAVSAGRFLANGWVEQFFVTPSHYFTFYGFEWIRPLEPWAMYALFWAILALGLLVAAGLFYRVAAVLLFCAFTYVELIDVTNYLNHYYLLSLLSLLMVCLPLHRCASLDARRDPSMRSETAPRWMLWLLRGQVAAVYVYAGLAKATSDWLLHAQPLDIWLSARTDLPILGPLMDEPWLAYALSWAGFLHDLLIVPLLLWRPTRQAAFGVLVAFHLATGLLFNIGMFPVIMICAATILLSPSWPRRLLRWRRREPATASPGPTTSPRWRALVLLAAGAWMAVQVLVPLRAHLYGGDVLWHEQGMRWSWRVMVREKNGDISYRVRVPGEERERRVSPSRYLTSHQEREMSGQPDLILQLAHVVADDFRARGLGQVEVRADAWVSLNGRAPARLVDPEVDLAAVQDGLGAASWILPGPKEPPPSLRPATRTLEAIARARSER